ncbi:MAG: hypothetical protein QM626_09645 [Microbacterium sp.]|uniref:FKBP-type peptidyl-prolyl cis-trans isomerase n=1 Tax=Microbacterium sp. TaxID=51671 RepID=UPI0039E70856
MRKLPAVLAAAALVTLALAGCSAGGAPTCERAASSSDIGSLVSVSGAVGTQPEVSVSTPLHVSGTEVADVVAGSGTTLVSDDQDVALGLTILSADTGDVLTQEGYDSLDDVTTVSQWASAIPGLEQALMCAAEGSRIVVGLDATALGSSASTLGLGQDDSAVAVIDVRKVYLSAADGADQYNAGFGLPVVVYAPSGQPGVIVPDAAAPTDTVVQLLKKGDGEVATAADTVRVNYTTVAWDTKTVTGTSWGDAPYQLDLSATDSISQAVVGQTVGSQLMVILPAGSSETGSTSAQVFVIDILGVDG